MFNNYVTVNRLLLLIVNLEKNASLDDTQLPLYSKQKSALGNVCVNSELRRMSHAKHVVSPNIIHDYIKGIDPELLG